MNRLVSDLKHAATLIQLVDLDKPWVKQDPVEIVNIGDLIVEADNILSAISVRQNRLERICSDDPIKVLKQGKDYTLIDGHHRVVLSLLKQTNLIAGVSLDYDSSSQEEQTHIRRVLGYWSWARLGDLCSHKCNLTTIQVM